jgi:prepilin-type N-terminal cleavage/methylation domain-containing protein
MLNKLKSKREGFTIIEVIIVLVIGAVIMLAVFLVVPQLQASQRNTRRQQYARQLLTAVQQYVSNNNGNVPKNVADITAIAGVQQDPSNKDYNIQIVDTNTDADGVPNITIRTGGATCTSGKMANGNGTVVTIGTEGGSKSFCVGD